VSSGSGRAKREIKKGKNEIRNEKGKKETEKEGERGREKEGEIMG
jgi:hypothetical protein